MIRYIVVAQAVLHQPGTWHDKVRIKVILRCHHRGLAAHCQVVLLDEDCGDYTPCVDVHEAAFAEARAGWLVHPYPIDVAVPRVRIALQCAVGLDVGGWQLNNRYKMLFKDQRSFTNCETAGNVSQRGTLHISRETLT